MCKDAVKKLPRLLRNVPDRYNQQMHDKAILENVGALNSVSDCYKKQEMCNKAVDNFLHALEFVPERCKTQKMCDKAVSSFPSATEFVPECFMTQEMCDKLMGTFLYLILYLIDIILKECVTKLFLKCLY